MMTKVILAILGAFHLATGLWMIADPMGWYMAVPGVAESGPANHHFIIDIGLAFIASGAGMMSVLRGTLTTAAFALAGATWPALHALFHIWGWFTGHAPTSAHMWLSEAVGVIVISLVGFALAWMHARKEGAV